MAAFRSLFYHQEAVRKEVIFNIGPPISFRLSGGMINLNFETSDTHKTSNAKQLTLNNISPAVAFNSLKVQFCGLPNF